jgi:hypothetical protein
MQVRRKSKLSIWRRRGKVLRSVDVYDKAMIICMKKLMNLPNSDYIFYDCSHLMFDRCDVMAIMLLSSWISSRALLSHQSRVVCACRSCTVPTFLLFPHTNDVEI